MINGFSLNARPLNAGPLTPVLPRLNLPDLSGTIIPTTGRMTAEILPDGFAIILCDSSRLDPGRTTIP